MPVDLVLLYLTNVNLSETDRYAMQITDTVDTVLQCIQ